MLLDHQIGAVIDVRSAPYSRFVPQFNRKSLGMLLKQADIAYVYLGDDLGGRPSTPDQYDHRGQVCYRRVTESSSFQSGLERVLEGASMYRVALMCSEENPVDCHRALLVAHELWHRDIPISHIRACRDADNSYAESHRAILERLIEFHELNQGTLIGLDGSLLHELGSLAELIEEAVERQRRQIAYVDRLHTNASEGELQG